MHRDTPKALTEKDRKKKIFNNRYKKSHGSGKVIIGLGKGSGEEIISEKGDVLKK